MPRTMRGCPRPWLQQKDIEEPETNSSVPQHEEQIDAAECEVLADYNSDINYKPEGSDPDIDAVHKEEENSYAEYVKMKLQVGTLHQRTINCKVAERIKWVHWAQGHEILAL